MRMRAERIASSRKSFKEMQDEESICGESEFSDNGK
jgi:hypothetical protein